MVRQAHHEDLILSMSKDVARLCPVPEVAEEVRPQSREADQDQVDRHQIVENSRQDQNQDSEDQRDQRLDREKIDVDVHVWLLNLNYLPLATNHYNARPAVPGGFLRSFGRLGFPTAWHPPAKDGGSLAGNESSISSSIRFSVFGGRFFAASGFLRGIACLP